MSRLIWGSAGERFYETGVDRGVLYLKNQDGVAWNGLMAVNETKTSDAPVNLYQDGIKIGSVQTKDEFTATIEALSAPLEFARCEGVDHIHNGLFIDEQKRETFNISYRTKIGNDTDGLDHGYKLHIVYNCLAAPSNRNRVTVADTENPMKLSWAIQTTPPLYFTRNPSAHMIIDSRFTPQFLLEQVEDILYGSIIGPARLIQPEELISLFTDYVEVPAE